MCNFAVRNCKGRQKGTKGKSYSGSQKKEITESFSKNNKYEVKAIVCRHCRQCSPVGIV